MTNWPKDNESALNAFYTRPDGSAKWEVTNLVYIPVPWKAYLAGTNIYFVKGVRVHKKVADSLKRIFASLWVTFNKSQVEINKVGLDQIGGTYYFRARRGSNRLSNHARGIAIDIDPMHNAMRPGNLGHMDPRIVTAFAVEGWRWGAQYGDPMHFEAVWNGTSSPTKPATISLVPKSTAPQDVRGWITAATPLIKRWEAFRDKRYWDVKQWAIGYGHNATGLPAETVWTEEYASHILADYLANLAGKIAQLVTVPLSASQGGAVLSFVYNLGIPNFAKSTLLKKLNARDPTVDREFGRWVKSGGHTLQGLVKRRAAEVDLFNS